MSASRQSSAQAYLQHHRVGALFEELMASLIRDQPQEPLLHLMRSLQRKASDRGLLKQQQSGLVGLDASASLRPSTAAPVKSMSATVGSGGAARSYDKPWLASTAGSVKSGIRKSSSGNVAASMSDYSAFERHRPEQQKQQQQQQHLWSAGESALAPATAAADANSPFDRPATAAEAAKAEADILGSEFRLAKGDSTNIHESSSANIVYDKKGPGAQPHHGRSAAAARQAAREARMQQLQAQLAAPQSAKSAADFAVGSEADDSVGGDELEADGVLLMEDADALAAEGVRLSRRTVGVGRAVATSRQRVVDQNNEPVEPQVRMTFCGRCFALINADEEAIAFGTAAGAIDTSRTADSVHNVGGGFGGDLVDGSGGGFGFIDQSAPSSGGVDEQLGVGNDDLEPFAAPNTGRTNATMTEVTDIESASQVSGPRRPSWNGGGGGGTGRSGASSRQKRSSGRQHQDSTGSASSNRAARGLDAAAAVAASAPSAVAISSSGRGWGVPTDEDDLSDQETDRNRHLQQDVRLY